MNRDKGIIAYGTAEDRLKLAVLASIGKQSGSEIMIDLIRKRYDTIFGDADPQSILNHQL